jgi:hypothetical protein
MSPRGSHLRCKRCGQARHRNVNNGLCGRCWGEVGKPSMLAERAALKQRRLMKQLLATPRATTLDIEDALILSADDPIAAAINFTPEIDDALVRDPISPITLEEEPPVSPRPYRANLTPEARTEIAQAYAAGLPIDEVLHTYNIGQGALYRILHLAGVPLRTRANGAAPVPTVAPTPALAAPVGPWYRWEVSYQIVRTETVAVNAANYADAVLGAALPATGAEIVAVKRLD